MADEHTGDEPIFVEANSDIFQYLLDYHRHRKVHIPFTVSKDAVLKESAMLGLSIKPEEIVQQTPPLAELSTLLASQTADSSQRICDAKAALLASLIMDVCVKKVGGRGPISVTAEDVLKAHGQAHKRCSVYNPGGITRRYECGQNAQQMDANTLEPTITFLAAGTAAADVRRHLAPLASRAGYRAELSEFQPFWNHTQFTCTLSRTQ